MTLHISFDNSYSRLPDRFFARQPPVPVAAPSMMAVNAGLARALGLDPAALAGEEGLAMVAGNAVPEGAAPLAQVYAGHQFGGFNPQLGDGRALLLGEITVPQDSPLAGQAPAFGRYDLQLKGSGPTPFSRRGDGRAWLGPVLREYLVSEAMAALGVPTTRALAAVQTGEPVLRENGPLPGAVLLRVAASHIRVGTFQYFRNREDFEGLRLLSDHVAARHYPGTATALQLLEGVIARQAALVAQWMSLGFIHGVMNTDNMTVSGETIDYGPCAFMDSYHPQMVFSSIDMQGRYAYANQPQIAVWNLAQLASSLLPLISDAEEEAIAMATEAVHRFPALYQAEWLARFRAKLGLVTEEDGDLALIEDLLTRMAHNQADFTRSFRALAEGGARAEFLDPEAFDGWESLWQTRLEREPAGWQGRILATSPAIIPRNHRIEEAITAAVEGNFSRFEQLNAALQTPFTTAVESPLRFAPLEGERVLRTFCGT